MRDAERYVGEGVGLVGVVRGWVESRWFGNVILGVILLAAVVVGVETYPAAMERYGGFLHTLDKIIIWVFVAEALLKMAAHGRRWYRYFYDPWNIFDFSIVVICFLPLQAEYAAVLRLARVLRALRLVSAVPKLQLLVGSLLKSLPSMMYVGVLLALMFYIYAVLGVFLFRSNDPVHFLNLEKALLSLFRVVTLEDWTDVMYAQMYGTVAYPPPRIGEYAGEAWYEPRAMPVVGAAYFVSFVMLGTMIMLNLFIGVILASMDEARAEQEELEREKNRGADGALAVEDELIELEAELEKMGRRVKRLAQRVK
ncbi:MAG: ion transporter [Planctomycetota bacterium]